MIFLATKVTQLLSCKIYFLFYSKTIALYNSIESFVQKINSAFLNFFQVFHKPCFNCFECSRPLDSTLCCDSPDGEIFCKACYGKIFGPKGYGYGGSGAMPALMAPNVHANESEDRIQ